MSTERVGMSLLELLSCTYTILQRMLKPSYLLSIDINSYICELLASNYERTGMS